MATKTEKEHIVLVESRIADVCEKRFGMPFQCYVHNVVFVNDYQAPINMIITAAAVSLTKKVLVQYVQYYKEGVSLEEERYDIYTDCENVK